MRIFYTENAKVLRISRDQKHAPITRVWTTIKFSANVPRLPVPRHPLISSTGYLLAMIETNFTRM